MSLYMGYFRPNRPGWNPYYVFFHSSILWVVIENDLRTNFQTCLKISLAAMVEIVTAMRAAIDSFEIYTKKIESNFIVSIALFWVAQLKQ